VKPRVLLADDHQGVIADLRALLDGEFDIVAAVADGPSLVAAAEALAHDVIVTDIEMPGFDGIAAAEKILGRDPDARIVFVTVHRDGAIVQKALAAGALGYVMKMTAGDELVEATRAALDGRRYVSAILRPLVGK
jgi:DNA-binding NarL/FixJ family response regulator